MEGWEVGGRRVSEWVGGWRGGWIEGGHGAWAWVVRMGVVSVVCVVCVDGGMYGWVWVGMGEGMCNDETTQKRNEK